MRGAFRMALLRWGPVRPPNPPFLRGEKVLTGLIYCPRPLEIFSADAIEHVQGQDK